MATLIKVNGDFKEVNPKNGKDFQLDELNKFVEGHIEIIDLNNGKILIINEEGKFSKKLNEEASILAYSCNAISPQDWIAGDVLICEDKEVQ